LIFRSCHPGQSMGHLVLAPIWNYTTKSSCGLKNLLQLVAQL
jgi:hypothetical protein